MRRIRFVLPLLAFAALAGEGNAPAAPKPAAKKAPNYEATSRLRPGQKAYPFTARDIQGRPVSLANYKGKVVVLDFWARWCIPCLEEIPNLRRIYSRHRKSGLEIISVNLDSGKDLLAFAKKNGMTWRNVHDGDLWDATGPLAKRYGVVAAPAVYVIDGTTRTITAKNVSGKRLEQEIVRALKNRG